jgi:hypothetical protein
VFDTAKEATLMLAEAQLVGGTFSRSGRFAGIAGDEVAFLYDVDNEEKRFDINSKYEYAWLTSFSEDESLLLIGVKSPAGSLVVDTESGRSLAFIPAQPDAIPRDVPPIWVSKTQRVVTFGRFNELVAWDWKSIQQQLVDLGLDWESTGNNEEYVVDYQPIQLTIAMDEELRQFHMTRGVDYRTHWPMQTTYESISSRIASNPDDVPLLLERARLTLDYHIGLLELARIDLDRAIGLSPENQTARDLRSQLARRRADWAEHIAQLKAVLEFAPSDHYRLRLIQALTLSPKRWQDLEFAKTLGEELEIPNLASRDYPQYVSALAAIDYCGGDLESAHDRLVGIAKFPWQTRPLLARIQWELGWKDKAYATYSAWQKGLSKRVHGPLTFRHAALLLQPIVSSKRLETGLNRLKFYPVELACHSIPESGPVNIQGLPRQSKLGHIFYWGATQAASMTLSITVDQPGRYSMTAALAAWDSAGAVSFEVNGKQVGDDPVEKSSQQPRVDLHAIGEVDLIAGENTITVFAHPSKATSRCRVGIAYLEFSRLASSND